jgi:hypothetical protein
MLPIKHQLVDPSGMLGRDPQRDRAPEAVADQAGFSIPSVSIRPTT